MADSDGGRGEMVALGQMHGLAIAFVNHSRRFHVAKVVQSSIENQAGICGTTFNDLRRASATLRAVAYNADFTQAVPSDPVEIIILPALGTTTAGGGSVAVDPPAGAWSSNGTAVVTATPAPGWTFLQWLGDATGTNPIASFS